jgi:hypothetical protein
MPPKEQLVHQQAELLHRLVPIAAQAKADAGGSFTAMREEELSRQLAVIWQALHPHEPSPPLQLPPPPLPTQIGPLNWTIVFGGGVPVGGWAQLTLYQNGAVNYTGHFHDSGGIGYGVSCVMAVRASDGTVYTFSNKGTVGGTFGGGSRDHDWSDNPTSSAIAAGWANLAAGWSWHGTAGANVDPWSLVDSAVKAVGGAASVIAII